MNFVNVKTSLACKFLLTLLCLLTVASCSRFRAYVPPEQIIYIRNDGSFALDTSNIFPVAVPLPFALGLEGSVAIPNQVSVADTTVPPHSLVGRLFLDRNTPTGVRRSWCTATLIDNTNVAITAAHCLYTANQGWVDNMQFILRAGGDNPRTFGWRCAAVKNLWVISNPGESITRGQSAVDVAFVLLSDSEESNLEPTTGATSSPVSISGYPGKHFSGSIMVTGDSDLGNPQGGALIANIDMDGGSSGSSWINGKNIHGVMSAGNNAGLVVGAPIDQFAKRVEEFVSQDCPEAEGQQASLHTPSPAEQILKDLADAADQKDNQMLNANAETDGVLPLSPVKVAFNPLGNGGLLRTGRAIQLVQNAGNLNCTFQCDQLSPLCNSVAVPFDYDDEINEVADLFRERRDVKKSEMMEIFQQVEDGCGRGDITVTDDRFENTGSSSSCVASSTYNVGSAENPQNVTLEVALPSTISGTLRFASDDIGATFDEGNEPGLLFDNDPNSIYSGLLADITTYKNAFVANLGGACLFMGASQ